MYGKKSAMEETQAIKESKPRLVFCIHCGEHYWESERCPYCDGRPKPHYDRLGITRFLEEDEYGYGGR